MAEKKKQHEFVVTDRRKFTDSGDLRPDAPRSDFESDSVAEQQSNAQSPPAQSNAPQNPASTVTAPASPSSVTSSSAASASAGQSAHPPDYAAPSEAEQKSQHEDYKQGSKKLDSFLGEKHVRPADFEMTFEKLIASLYMTAMMQLGLMVHEGEEPRADILGARQTIDTLGLLTEKTKGNLTSAEQMLLQQSLFELRMAFLELTNALTRPPAAGAPPGAPFGPGGKSFGGKK
jgi:Domain of unknown function (DUF1844)